MKLETYFIILTILIIDFNLKIDEIIWDFI